MWNYDIWVNSIATSAPQRREAIPTKRTESASRWFPLSHGYPQNMDLQELWNDKAGKPLKSLLFNVYIDVEAWSTRTICKSIIFLGFYQWLFQMKWTCQGAVSMVFVGRVPGFLGGNFFQVNLWNSPREARRRRCQPCWINNFWEMVEKQRTFFLNLSCLHQSGIKWQ